jgi:dienelactone hydrolase
VSQDVYFTTLDYLRARFDATGRRLALKAQRADELEQWQHEVRAILVHTLGLDTMRMPNQQPRLTEQVELDGYVRQRIEIETEPGVVMPIFALVPLHLRPGERRPCMIAPHGHGSGGKLAVAGRRDIPEVAETIEKHRYDYGVQLVRRGFVVFCPDARGFGERREIGRQSAADLLDSSCNLINHMAVPLGQTVTGMWTWDLMRLIDYIATRPDCDASRLGCAGLSGGGLQTLWLAAMDVRVRCAVVSGYFYGYKESLLEMNGNCSCNYVPGLWQLVDIGDVAALVAPRPMLIETGSRDPLNGRSGLDNVRAQLDITRRAYRLTGADAALAHDVFDGEHRWNGAQAIPFLEQYL